MEQQLADLEIDKEFIMRDDLRDFIFQEDSEGDRYRERIWELINEIGVENWFKAKGYPTDEKSVWKNRYGGSLTTLGDEIYNEGNERRKEDNLEKQGYLLWENYLPENMWNDKNLNACCRIGTKEYDERQKEEIEQKKKEDKIERIKIKKDITTKQNVLFKEKEFEEIRVTKEEIKGYSPLSKDYKPELKKEDEKRLGQKIYDKQQEWLKKDNLCSCGKERVWDIKVRDKCAECLKKHFTDIFEKNGIKDGFRDLDETYTFY